MAEERTLVANLVPKIAQSDIDKFIQELQNELSTTVLDVGVGGGKGSTGGTATGTSTTGTIGEAITDAEESRTEAEQAQTEVLSEIRDAVADSDDAVKSTGSNLSEIKNTTLSGLSEMVKVGFGASRMVLGYVEKFWKRLEMASPALKNVMSMIDNAVNLFLMPIGTAFAMELIPLVTNLYDNVFEVQQMMWDAYEEDGISGMIRVGLEYALPVLLEFAHDAWELIPDDIPVISDIKEFVSEIMSWFVENKEGIANIIGAVLDIGAVLVTNLKLVISAVTGFAMAYFISKAAEFSVFGMEVGAVAGGVGMAAMYGTMSYIENKATGGPVDPVPGGKLVRLGEAGEREHVVPESKIPEFVANHGNGAGASYTINFYGVTEQEFIDKVEDIINERTAFASLRGGF